jgi:hypothetical protein
VSPRHVTSVPLAFGGHGDQHTRFGLVVNLRKWAQRIGDLPDQFVVVFNHGSPR